MASAVQAALHSSLHVFQFSVYFVVIKFLSCHVGLSAHHR